MNTFKTEVISNEEIAQEYFELIFKWPAEEEQPKPGQFLTIRTNQGADPLLRRPFAFSDYNPEKGEAAIIYQKVGPGTLAMTKLRSGDPLDILGPVGNHFQDPKKEPISLAGGIGTGPMVYWANHLARHGKESTLILGVRTKNLIPTLRLEDKVKLEICTDDGSRGFKGNTVQRLDQLAQEKKAVETYGCGPEPMLKAMSRWADENDQTTWVSMEQYMACAVGACMGCVIKVKDPERNARVCVEGPIFDGRKVLWT